MSEAQPRLAVQLYTFRAELAEDAAGTIARIAALGFAGVEPVSRLAVGHDESAGWTFAPAVLRDLLDAHGLAVCGAHTVLPEGPGAEAVLDEQEILGNDLLIVSSLNALPGCVAGDLGSADTLARVVERFDAAAALAAARGMRVGYHNHWWEWDRSVDGQSGFDAFWARVDPSVVAEVDAYWAQVAGRDPAAVVTALGERVALLHLKDGPLVAGEPMAAIGSGRAEVAAVLAAAGHARWQVVELDEVAGDTFAAVERSARWLVEHGLAAGR